MDTRTLMVPCERIACTKSQGLTHSATSVTWAFRRRATAAWGKGSAPSNPARRTIVAMWDEHGEVFLCNRRRKCRQELEEVGRGSKRMNGCVGRSLLDRWQAQASVTNCDCSRPNHKFDFCQRLIILPSKRSV